jgi:hypothetical protein
VDLTEVERCCSPRRPRSRGPLSVRNAIEAYLMLADGADVSAVEREITTRLAAYKRPRRLHR